MTGLLAPKRRKAASPTLQTDGLVVERTDIVFANVTPDLVHIAITVHNRGAMPTAPTPAVIQAAPLGAFVPWRPLATAQIPLLLPGDSHTIQLDARPARPLVLGRPERTPPRRLQTALANDDDPDARDQVNTLPADVFGLLSHGNPHFAGNLNIFFAGKDVERHLAQALRIYPGRSNMAMFVVGTLHDAYAFSLQGSGAAWDAELYDAHGKPSLVPARDALVAENEWREVGAYGIFMLAIRPPADAKTGQVEVHLEQRSTGKQAIVEFSLDARAAGPGCFVVP